MNWGDRKKRQTTKASGPTELHTCANESCTCYHRPTANWYRVRSGRRTVYLCRDCYEADVRTAQWSADDTLRSGRSRKEAAE